MLTLKNFSFSYSEQEIFRDVNLQLSLEKPVLLQGVNGSGTTTLARILCGLIRDYSGEIDFAGKPLAQFNHTELTEKILYVKQEAEQNFVAASLNEDLQIWQHGFSQPETEKVERERQGIFHKFMLQDICEKLLWQLSGGQQKCGSLAPILLPEKKIWMLDEPAAGLDADSLQILLELIAEKRTGVLIFSNRKIDYDDLDLLSLGISDKKIIRFP